MPNTAPSHRAVVIIEPIVSRGPGPLVIILGTIARNVMPLTSFSHSRR
jgi:hypothetical protein